MTHGEAVTHDVPAIDIHHHAVTDSFRERLAARSAGPAGLLPGIPGWTADATLRWMDASQIERAILSPPARGFGRGDPGELRTFSNAAHHELLSLRDGSPDRFGVLAPLPLPSLDDALTATETALRSDGVDGISALTQYGGRYLGEPAWDDLLELFDSLGALVHVHPTSPKLSPLTDLQGSNLVEYVFDTTRVAVLFGKRRIYSRFPNIRWVFAHGAGTFPYVLDRLDEPEGTIDGGDTFAAMLAVSCFDTALVGRPALAALTEFAGHDRLLFGSDSPFIHGPRLERLFETIDSAFADPAIRFAVKRGTAERVLGAAAARPPADTTTGPTP
jgi:predicted TIM-barrel fold metal-dependent hydrolase